jgi:hypothetical protein
MESSHFCDEDKDALPLGMGASLSKKASQSFIQKTQHEKSQDSNFPVLHQFLR